MKIISKGVLPEDRDEKLEGTCLNCLCKVQFTSKEAENREGNFGILCPTKGCDHYIVGQKPSVNYWEIYEKIRKERIDPPTSPFYPPIYPVDPFYEIPKPSMPRPCPGTFWCHASLANLV